MSDSWWRAFSILAGLAILVAKYWAYRISGSAALLSDAIEGVVNVVAAVFALGAVLFSERPPDREHPYGHGKIEHFSAAFEGGLISLAAALILWEAIDTLIHGSQIRNLGMGILLNVGAGMLNGLLGLFLVRMGRRHRQPRHRGGRTPRPVGLLDHGGPCPGLARRQHSRACTGWTRFSPSA